MRVLQALAVVSRRGLRERSRRRLRSRERRRPAPGAPAAPARGRQGPPPLGPNGTSDPFPNPIPAEEGAIKVNFVEFATLPDVGVNAARPMLMSYEPGTRRLFVNDMHGALYTVSNDGKTVTPYFDHQDPRWNIPVQFQNFERGFQSFAFHPDFNRRGRAWLRKDLHLHRHQQRHADAGLDCMRRARRCRIMRCSSSGPRRIRQPQPTMATPRAS